MSASVINSAAQSNLRMRKAQATSERGKTETWPTLSGHVIQVKEHFLH